MRTFTQTKVEVATWAADRHFPLGCNQVHKLAERVYRMQDPQRPDEDMAVILGRVFGLPDPTPREAFRNIARNDECAARRLGLVTA